MHRKTDSANAASVQVEIAGWNLQTHQFSTFGKNPNEMPARCIECSFRDFVGAPEGSMFPAFTIMEFHHYTFRHLIWVEIHVSVEAFPWQ